MTSKVMVCDDEAVDISHGLTSHSVIFGDGERKRVASQ